MTKLVTEKVTSIHHWNDTLFSFKTTREHSFRFNNGHFVMIGLEIDGIPLMRAYSIVSANYEDELEFFSIKVENGPLTSHLRSVKIGDEILVSTEGEGTLVADNLLPGKHLYLICTGTGLAPFMSIIKDPDIYDRYEKIILAHGTRYCSELAYENYITQELPNNEFFGDVVKDKLIYYPAVTREKFKNNGRLTDLLTYGKLFLDIGINPANTKDDRFMICGNPSMLADTCKILDKRGFSEFDDGKLGHYVIEKAFVEA